MRQREAPLDLIEFFGVRVAKELVDSMKRMK
jgi:hypothetical protein